MTHTHERIDVTTGSESLTVALMQHEDAARRIAAPLFAEHVKDALTGAWHALEGQSEAQQGLVTAWSAFRELLDLSSAHMQARAALMELAQILNRERVAALSDLDDALNNYDATMGRKQAYEDGYADARQDLEGDAYVLVADDMNNATGIGSETSRRVLEALTGGTVDGYTVDTLIEALCALQRDSGR